MNETSGSLSPARGGRKPWTSLRGLHGPDCPRSGLSRVRTAVLLFLVWTAFGLCQAAPEMLTGFSFPNFAGTMIQAWCWALLTPAILFVDRKLTSTQRGVIQLSLAHLVLSVPFTFTQVYLSSSVEYPYAAIWWNPLRDPEYFKYYFVGGWTAYMTFVAALQTLKFYNRLMTSQVELAKVEKRLVESNLNALRLQLEPHFLFNTLNAISCEVVADPELAREMIEDLGALLRRSLDCQGSTEITLAQELALLDHYIAIQKLRFGDRIDIQVDADPMVLSTLVPSMLLQPIVENAIRHGLEGRLTGGMVAVKARHIDGDLGIEVADDGAGLPASWNMLECKGLGVRATRERLDALYGHTGSPRFTMSRRKGGGTNVTMRIPLHTVGADSVG